MEKCITTVLNNPPTEEDGEQSTPLVDVVSGASISVTVAQLYDFELVLYYSKHVLFHQHCHFCLFLFFQLFKDCKIIQRILQEWEDHDSDT